MTRAPYPIPAEVVTPCAADPDLMFADRKSSPKRLEAAKRVCVPCGYRDGCLMWALTRGEEGVWAGTDDEDRKHLAKRMKIVVERPRLGLPRARNDIPHGTAVGVEAHRKRYDPLCDECSVFATGRISTAPRNKCNDCGKELQVSSMSKHRRRSCPGKRVAA
jgi:hypothetical protein